MSINIRKICQKSFLIEIKKLRIKGENGLNDGIYRHIKPGQDVIYVRKLKELLDTYLWIRDNK